MKILITGIAGFAGSHLAELLVERGDEVFGTCLACETRENLRDIIRRLHLSNCDVTDLRQLARLVKRIAPDQIYHLAALTSVGWSFSHPVETLNTNLGGTLNVLEIVRSQKKCIKILVVGSSDIYGRVRPEDVPLREERPLRPVSPYGASKAACDLLAYQYFQSYGVHVIRARAFNHAGPRQNTGFVVPDFASQIARVEAGQLSPVLKVGDLSARRDVSDVRDVVRAYAALMARGKPGEAYNICSGKAYKIEHLLRVLLSLSRERIRVQSDKEKSRPAEIPLLLGDNLRLKKATGWKPKVPLEKTLKDALDFWRRRFGVFD
jgi:GDP-4-dehydro-6-deoxy-D-mannose reductase